MPRWTLLLLMLSVSCASTATQASSASVHDAAMAIRPEPPPEPLQRTVLSLPFQGVWTVIQGYKTQYTHRGYAAYALDLVKLDAR